MQPFVLSAELERRYADYIRTAFPFADPTLQEQIERKISREHLLSSGPIVSLQRPFAPGPSAVELERSGLLHPTVAQIFSGFRFHRHQVEALERLSDREGRARSAIITTGTGSGKTEAFLLPILDYCGRHSGEGVKALLVYPMNALANDQLNRLRNYLRGTGITFGRYTGDTRETDGDRPGDIPEEECWSRDAIRKRRPNLLLTSYRMLEYLLVRRQDQPIFRPGGAPPTLRYLVLDEVHSYDGALGAEIACLVRRLRGHLDLRGPALVCIGTSATVGHEQADAVCAFASDLFADTIDRAGLITERYAERPPTPGALARAPVLDDAELGAVEQLGEREENDDFEVSPELKSALEKLCGSAEWPNDWSVFQRAMFEVLTDRPMIRWLSAALTSPKRLAGVVAESLQVSGREDSVAQNAEREIAALLTLGTIARNAEGALLRPRLHAFFRGLARTTRCVACGELQANGAQVCASCHGIALPLEICHVCGQDYLRTAAVNADAPLQDGTLTRTEGDDETAETPANALRLARNYHKVNRDPDADDDEPGENPPEPQPHHLHRVAYCVACGFLRDPVEGVEEAAASPCRHCGQERVVTPILAGKGPMLACANCHGRYGSRGPITGLRSSTAVGTSILTWILMGRLPADERRLLIFADSRQDTAYQAGYLADVTAEYAWRQVAFRMVSEQHRKGDVPYDLNGFWTRVYQFGLERYAIFSRDDRQQQLNNLRWFLLKEFGRDSQRRSALEYLGLVTCEYRGIEDLERYGSTYETFCRAARAVPGRVAFTTDDYRELLTGVLDIIRGAGALSDEYTLRFWPQNEPLRGLDDYNRRSTIFRRLGGAKSNYANIRPIAGVSAQRTKIEKLLARAGVEDPRAAAAAAADLLREMQLLTAVRAGGHQAHQREEGLAVNAGRLSLVYPENVWQCGNCRALSVRPIFGLCASANCPDWHMPSLVPFDRAREADNFYATMYASFEPIRIEAREHSGQISGEKRMEYEEGFRQDKINVLVASPTLELGVDIGSLATVLLRGLPPSPANYAQRAGRAGRRERIALVNAYAQESPHDSYFFREPERMVSGTIDVPAFDLDNQEIVRRHIRALALEKLVAPLPTYMCDFLDIREIANPSADQVIASKLVGAGDSMAQLAAKRDAIIDAVASVFSAERHTWLSRDYVREVLERFEADLARVLDRWHTEVVELAREIGRINQMANPPREDNLRRQHYQRTLDALTRRSGAPGSGGSSDSYTLGYLSSHGFLPSYAFPGEAASLFAPDISGGEIIREPSIALSEFAPENIVYVDSRKLVCEGLFLQRHGAIAAGADPSVYIRCDGCGHIASRTWVGSCPRCGAAGTQSSQARLEPSTYRAREFQRIGASEESRQRRLYDVKGHLLDAPQSSELFEYTSCGVILLRRQPLINVNSGRLVDGVPQPFEICSECGDVKPTHPKGDWIAQHRKRRNHEPRLQVVHLTNTLTSDVVAIEPLGMPDAGCLTLRYALLAAAAVEFSAGERELDGLEETTPGRGTCRTLLYERISGGVGYVRRIPAALPRLAGLALTILRHETPCVKACYLCLLNYYNQRDHNHIDKTLIVDFLDAVSHEQPAEGRTTLDGPIAGAGPPTDTDWEHRLLRALEARGLRGAVCQFEVREPDGKIVTIPDIAYPTERIAIYIDGDAHHTSPEDRAHDDRVRTRARELGWRIAVFPNARVTSDVQGCVAEVEHIVGTV